MNQNTAEKQAAAPLGLGALLQKNIEEEKAATLEAARRRAEVESAEAKAAFAAVEAFFEHARQKFITGILNQTPYKKLFVSLGQNRIEEGFQTAARHMAANTGSAKGLTERLNLPGNKFHPIWKSFCQWADSEGLEVFFQDQHDGGGYYSWYELHVRPKSSSST